MRKEELQKVYWYAFSIWSSFKKPDKHNEQLMMDNIWFDFLKDYDVGVIYYAMKKHSEQSDFCNVGKVAAICDMICAKVKGTYVDENDVYSEIRKAIVSPDKEAAFQKLSPIAKKIVDGPWQLYKWGQMEAIQVESVVMSLLKGRIVKAIERQKDDVDLDKKIGIMFEIKSKMIGGGEE